MSACFLNLCCSAAMLLLGQNRAPDGNADRAHLVNARIENRIVKRFDFDERKLGNYEDLPMNWDRIAGPGYARFLRPRFDDDIGHDAPPSLRLSLAGGSLGTHYLAKDIPVHPGSEYHVTAWVRPAKLEHARAFLTAYYLDHAFQRIDASERQSEAVQGERADEPWTRVTIRLPGGLQEAAWIGLTCRIRQSEGAPPNSKHLRPIDYHDVHGIAWFDDITVLRLPIAGLRLSAPGNLFQAGQPVECVARVADPDGAGITADLQIFSADDEVLQTHAVPIVRMNSEGVTISVGTLPSGWYVARLTVRAGAREVLFRQREFVCLNPDVNNSAQDRHGIGLILDPTIALHDRITQTLLDAISPDMVKVPLWSRDTTDSIIVRGNPSLDSVLRAIRGLQITVVGVLEAPPESLAAQDGRADRTLPEVLCSPPGAWRPYLALMLTRYGSHIWAWQVGADENRALLEDERFATAIDNVRTELRPLIGSPDVVAPIPIHSQVGVDDLAVDIASLTVPAYFPSSRLPARLADFKQLGFTGTWATIESPDVDRYARMTRLAEFARRIVFARHSGIDTVFTRQPWMIGTEDGAPVVAPREEFIVLRTLSQALGGLDPVAPVWIDHGVRAWFFADASSGSGALVTWTEAQGAPPREAVADLGPDVHRIDMWANIEATHPATDGRTFDVEPMPTILAPIDPWRGGVLAGFSVDDATFQVAVAEHARTVSVANPAGFRLRGTLRLVPPAGWQVQPQRVEIDLDGGETARIAVGFRIPNNQGAGDYTLLGRLTLEEEEGLDGLTLRAPLHVGSPGLDVNVMTALTGRQLNIAQRVTNLTDESISIRTHLIAPGLPTDSRLIHNLAAGQSAVREYRIDDARHLAGKHIRVSAQQIGGPLRHNQVIKFD